MVRFLYKIFEGIFKTQPPSLQSMALFDEISGVHEQNCRCAGVHHQKFLVCWCAPTIFPWCSQNLGNLHFNLKNAKEPRVPFLLLPFLLFVWVIPIEAQYQRWRLNKDFRL